MIHTTTTILPLLKALLEALTLTPPTPLFEKVEVFSMINLLQALEDLRVFKNRVCLVIPGDDAFENEVAGRELRTPTYRSFHLLMADRNYGARQRASTGSVESTNPGVIVMKEKVEDALVGINFGLLGARVRPIHGEPFALQDDDRDAAAGRECWKFEISVEAGTRITSNR